MRNNLAREALTRAVNRAIAEGAPIYENLPMAAPGLISYRARGRYGWIMIGAKDKHDAMREAKRSTPAPYDLQRWNGESYEPIAPHGLAVAGD